MTHDPQDFRKAQIAELQRALQLAMDALDQLEQRVAAKKLPAPPDLESNPIASRIAAGIMKARTNNRS
jgi:hypothetical protein